MLKPHQAAIHSVQADEYEIKLSESSSNSQTNPFVHPQEHLTSPHAYILSVPQNLDFILNLTGIFQ